MAHMMSSDDDDSRQMFGNYGNESKIKTSGGDEPYSPSAPTDPTDTWSPKGLAKHMSAYSDIFEDPEVDPTEGSSSGSGGAKPKNTLKPRSTSMSDNRSPPRGGSSGVKRKSDDLSDSDSDDDDDGHLQEGGASYSRLVQNSDGDSDSSDSSPSAATCAICLGKMRGEVGSPNVCEHTFCFECILEWSNNNATCPQDRKIFNLILVRQHLGGTIVSELPVEQPQGQVEVVEENPTYCEVCAQCDREDRLLLCDGCDMGYHLECLTPPLSTVPIEEWYCPICVKADLPQSAGSSSWEQRSSSSVAGPSSSSSGSRGSRSSQSESRSSRSGENRGTSRRRLIPRTQAAERLRLKIVKKKKAKKAERRKRKNERKKKVRTHENDNKLHRWGKDSEGADVDSMYNSDDEATKILDGNSRQKHYSSLHAKERQEEKRANAAKVIRDGFFIPRPSYAGAKTSVVTRVALAPQPSVDILGDIFESQAIAFGSSKDLTLTEDRKLQPKDPKKFEEGSLAKDIPLPSNKSSKSHKEGTQSPSISSKSKYKSSPRSSKRSPSPKSSKRSLSPRNSKRSPSPKISKRSPSPKISKRSPSPRSSRRSPSPRNSKRSPSPRNSKRSSSPKRSKHSPSPKNSKRSPSPKSSKRSSSPRSSRRSPSSRHFKRTPSPRGYKKRSPSPKIRKSSQDYKREYPTRTDRSRDDKYYSPLESRNKSPPKMSYGRPVSSGRRDRDRRRSYSPEERGYKADYKKTKNYSPKRRQSKGSRSPETVFYDRSEREKSPYRKDKTRDGYRDFHKGDKGYDKKDRSPQRKDRSPYREKSPHRRDYSPIRERSPQRRDKSPFRERSPRRRELSPRRESSPFRSHKITSHVSRSRERSLGREKIKVRERSQWSHSYFNSNGNDVNKSNTNSYSVHSVHNVQSSSKSLKGEISKRDSSQDSSDEKSKTSRSSSKDSSSSDSTSDSSSSGTEKNSEDEASEQLSLHSVGNLMMTLKNKKTINDKGTNKKKSKKEKDSKGKIKKVSSQHRVPENIKRRSMKDTITVSDETEEDEQPIQTINKLKVEPRSSKLKSSSKDKESKRKKRTKRRHKSSSSSSSSNNSESDSSDTEESDKEKSKGKFKNIESQKLKGKIKNDLEGPSSIGEKKISISLKDNFSIKINKKNALGVEEEPTKKLSGLPLPEKEVFTYHNPYEKKRISHYTAPEEKEKIVEIEKKPASSLFERTSLVVAASNEVKDQGLSKKVSVKRKSVVPSIPLPDEKLVREEAIRNDVIKDLIEENDIIKDALMQGSNSQRDVIKDAIKGVIGSKTDKSSIKVKSHIAKNPVVGVHDLKKSIHTSIPSKSIPTIPLPSDAPKKKDESDDEIEEVWRKAVPGSSRRRSGDIKLNLLTDKARNDGKSKGQAEMRVVVDDDDDIIGIQVSKKKDDSHDVLNKIKKQTHDEDRSKNKNEIKNLSEINQDKKPHKSENKEKEKYQSHKDSLNQVDGKQPKGTPKKDTSNLYAEKKSDIPGLDLISPKKRDSLDIELPTERKRTYSRSFGSDDFDFSSTSFDYSKNLDNDDKIDFKTSFNISKFIDGEMGKQSKVDREFIKRQRREMEKERKVAECLKAFHRHKGIDSEDEQEFKGSTDDLILDRKAPKQTEIIEKRRSSTHGLVDKFVLQNNPDMKDNSEDEDKPYSPTEDKPYSPTQERPYSPTQERPYSPTQERPYSPTQERPYSPTQERPYSPTQEKPYSPTQDKPYSPTQSAHLESEPEVEDDVPYSPSQHVPDETMPVPKPSSPGPPNKRLQTPGQLQINKGLLESKVIEEVKRYLDPYYRDKTFNREQYKQIVSKCVDKVVNVECGYVIEPQKMQKLVDGYVKLFKHRIKKDRMLKL